MREEVTVTPSEPSPPSEALPSADPFRRILVPVDMSHESRAALSAALELQRAYGSEVRVVTLTDYGDNDEYNRGLGVDVSPAHFADAATERLRRFVENSVPGALDRVTLTALEEIDVPGGIDRVATEWGATLVVLTTHHAHPGLFRTQAEKTINALDVPVLFLKPHA
jgi:nucleotide-binding universal stress UspA family protein